MDSLEIFKLPLSDLGFEDDGTLPSPELVNYWKLRENRIFYIEGEILEDILEIQKNIILINMQDRDIKYDNRKPIYIYINTPGGNLAETMSLAHTIKLSKTKVITVNIASAYSGGAFLLMTGHERYCMPYSRALVHQGSGCTYGTYEQTESWQKNYKNMIDDVGNFIVEQTKIDEKLYKRNRSKEWFMNSDEQLKYGLVDKIVTSLDDIM